MPDIIFGTQSYESMSLPVSAQRMLNCYVEMEPQGSKAQVPIFGGAGMSRFVVLPTSPVRGLWNFRGVLYAVSGDTVYRINRGGGYKALGAGITGSQVVSMSDNGIQLMIVNGLGGFIVDQLDAYQQIQSPNFNSASTVLFFDDYFVVDRKGTNQFGLSALIDGLSWNGLDFASAEAQPGFLTAVAQNLQLLFLFCQNHLEMWYDAGAADFPFQRYAGGVIPKGCLAPHSIVPQDSALFFLGSDGVFYRLQGNSPIRVSTHALEQAWQKYGDISDAFCFTYTLGGHKMVHLTFPSVPHSWVFDIATGMWHERESRDAQNNALGRWRGNCAAEVYNKILIGDAFSGTIGVLDSNVYDELGTMIEMRAVSAPVHEDKLPVFINRLELDMEAGVGLTTGQGSDPKILLRWSKNGGRTWSNLQPPRSVGKIGEFQRRQRWINLGRAYQWIFEVTITDPVKKVIVATHSDAVAGMR